MGLRKIRMGSRNIGMHYRIIPGNVRVPFSQSLGSSSREKQGPGWESPCQAAGDTYLLRQGCSESELWELPGGFWLLRFIQAFSLGGGAGITLGFSSRDLGGGEGGSSSFPRGSFSRDFSLSLLRVAVGTQTRVGAAGHPGLGRSGHPGAQLTPAGGARARGRSRGPRGAALGGFAACPGSLLVLLAPPARMPGTGWK